MNAEIRVLGPADAVLLSERSAADVFDEEVAPQLAAEFLADARHHIVGAIEHETLVGFASAVDYVHPDKPRELWINEVGVAPTHRRRGIGRALLEELLAHGRRLGCREAWLGTEPENVAALALYRSIRANEQPMVYVTFPLGERDGSDADAT